MRRLTRFVLLGMLALAPLPLAAENAPDTSAAPAQAAPQSAAPVIVTTGEATATTAASPTDAPAKAAAEVTPPAPPAPPPDPTLIVDINLTTQRMVVTENGKSRYIWAVSSGAYGYATPTGTFRPSWMSKLWYSKQYDNAPMPHSIFFKGGAAIHATSSIHLLGTPASHGCVRLSPSNAAKLYTMVSQHGKERTRISVHGRAKYTAPPIARLRPQRYASNPYYDGGFYPPPRYAYPDEASRRYYVQSNRQRAAAIKKRRAASRQYYSAY